MVPQQSIGAAHLALQSLAHHSAHNEQSKRCCCMATCVLHTVPHVCKGLVMTAVSTDMHSGDTSCKTQ